MRCEAVLRALGDRIARRNVEAGVGERFAAKWQEEWQRACDEISKGNVTLQQGQDDLCALAGKMTLAAFLFGLGE